MEKLGKLININKIKFNEYFNIKIKMEIKNALGLNLNSL